MKKNVFIFSLIFSFALNGFAQESKTYYEKVTGSGTANEGEYNYEATLEANIYNSGLGGIAVKIGIKEYKITSFTYKDNFYHKIDEGFPIQINNIQSDLIDGYLNIKSVTDHYSVAGQKFSLLGIRKGHLDNVELNNENIESIKNYNIGGKVSFDNFYLEYYGKLENTYFEELANIVSSQDEKKLKKQQDDYLAQQKEKAQEKLKEIEIAQERDRKARESEALKPENYYKSSSNSTSSSGYPVTGYQKAQQDIKRVEASYDALQQSINKLAIAFISNSKSERKDFDAINQHNSNIEIIRDRRKNEVEAIYNANTMVRAIDEGDDYPFEETSIYSEEFRAFIETLKHTTATHLFIKYVGWEQIAGVKNIKAYYSSSNMYLGSKNEFDSNEKPIFKVLFGGTQSILVNEILQHPYLFSLYMENLPRKAHSLSPNDFLFNPESVLVDRYFLFLNESTLDQMISQIKSTYQSASTLQCDSYYKTDQKTFQQYVAGNLQKEQQFNHLEEAKKFTAKRNEQMKNGTFEGYGSFKFKSGNKYEGYYKDSKKNGFGTYYYATGAIYQGYYKDDKKNGEGTYNYEDGSKYVGSFKDGMINGKGIYYLANGTIEYEGSYKEGKRNGEGILYYTNGSKYKGTFKDGEVFNGINYDSNGNEINKIVNGKIQNTDGENDANEEKEFKIAITNPQYEGGTEALTKYLSNNLQFSEADMGGLTKVKVYVNFTVTKSGEITDVSVGKGVNEALDKEAVRIIKSMPYWIPGTQNGERVSLKMTLPIIFVNM